MKYFLFLLVGVFLLAWSTTRLCAQEGWRRLSIDSIYRLADLETDEAKYIQAKEKLSFLMEAPGLSAEISWKTYSLMGYTQYFLGEYLESSSSYELALVRHRSVGDTARMISTLRGIGMNYRKLGLFGLSLGSYHEALRLATTYSKGQESLHELYNSISLLYSSQKNSQKSLEYSKRTIDLAKTAGDSLMLSFAYTNSALAFHDLRQYDSSIFYNYEALKIKRLTNETSNLASNYNNLGLDFLDLGQYGKAQELFDSAGYWYRANQSAEGKIILDNNYGALFLRTNQLQKAREHLVRAETLLQVIPNKRILADNLESQVDLFKGLGEFRKALEVQTRLGELKEAIFQEEVLNTQRLEAAFLLNEKENQRKVVELDAELVREEKNRITQLLFFIVTLAILLSILTSNYFTLNKRLKAKNAIIELQKTDIIHRTNNVLSKIQSVLKIIAFGFESSADKEKLMLAESVIISAGRLQEATYSQSDTKAKINLGPYLNNVAQQVIETFDRERRRVNLQTNWDTDLLIPEEKILNIGIIVSELVLNAVKYAFDPEDPICSIWVAISSRDKNVTITVRDNGNGIPGTKPKGTGTEMIERLVKFLPGKLYIETGHKGTLITLTTTVK